MMSDPAYDQVAEGVQQVRGLVMALHGLQTAAETTPQPVGAEKALRGAIGRALDDVGALLEAHYHPVHETAA